MELSKKYQNPDGSFSTKYLSGPGDAQDVQLRIGMTGHVLEWLALALSEEELKEGWVEEAGPARTAASVRAPDHGGGATARASPWWGGDGAFGRREPAGVPGFQLRKAGRSPVTAQSAGNHPNFGRNGR